MKEIDHFNQIIRQVSPKGDRKDGDYKNALKGSRTGKSRKSSNSSNNYSHLKLEIHKKLQGIDLSDDTGKEEGRKVFIELTLKNESKTLDGIDFKDFVTNINKKVYFKSDLGSELDKIIKKLQASAKNV